MQRVSGCSCVSAILSACLLTSCLACFFTHCLAFCLARAGSGSQISIFLNFWTSVKDHEAAFSYAFIINFVCKSHISKHFLMLHMAIHIDLPLKFTILIKFKFQIQFVMFRRGPPGTPIDPAPVLLSGIHCSTSQGQSRFFSSKIKFRRRFRPHLSS